jgi:hypothetical protein
MRTITKTILTIVAILFVGACSTTPTMKSVAGTYEIKRDGHTGQTVLLENGTSEMYMDGKKRHELGAKWNIIDGEIHAESKVKLVGTPVRGIYKINKDGSITAIAMIDKDGKRLDVPKHEQGTYKKIK